MDKKKIGLLIIVLFLIIGLGSFVFANPDNQENFEEGDIEERDGQGSDRDGSSSSDDDSSDEDETDSSNLLTDGSDNQLGNAVDNDNSRGNNLSGNGNDSTLSGGTGQTSGTEEIPTITDNTYADALKAVEQAESSLVQGDVDYATGLVNQVTNQSQKDELNSRLEAVQDIIDVTALIERLETMVANSTNRDGIVESIDYRDDEKIEELVTNLNNGTAKDNLASRLETVNKILNDSEGPVISGIRNDSFTRNDSVSLTISDDNEVTTTVMFNGNPVDYTDSFTEEGTYVVTAVDAAFNEKTLTFTIDRTKPVVGGVEDGKYYNTDVAVTIDDANPGTVHLHKNGELVKPYNAGDPITEEGTYTVVVTDKADNKSKEITFVIDKHVEEPKWVYILNLSDENNRKTIRNGQTLRVEVNFDEELTELPVLTIGNSQSTTFRECSETDYAKYICVADLTIDNTIANLEDGEIPFTITNIYDKAGNTITLDNANVTETKEYGQVTYDGTAPVIRSLGIVNLDEFKDEVGRLYAKTGDTVRVRLYFDEELGTEPTVKLGGKEFTATYREDSPKYAYYADIELTEDMNLSDGILSFEVYGYKDAIGNVGVNLTQDNINETAYPSVTIDNTLPVLNFNNGFITSGYTVEVTDDNFAYMTVQYYDGRGTETIESNTFTLDKEGDNVRYKIRAYDKAGNVSSDNCSIYLDNVAPSISNSIAINGGKEVSVENNGTYQEVTLNISDGSLKKVSLVKEDGTEEVLETYKDNFKNTKLTFEKKYAEEGTYTIKAVDRNNNESTITFTIDNTPAKVKAANILVDGDVNEQQYFYAKIGDTIYSYVRFSEKLKELPTFTLINDGNEYKAEEVIATGPNDAGEYTYSIRYSINEDTKMSDGEITMLVTNIKDLAGNKTDDVVKPTNSHIVYLDTTAPVFKDAEQTMESDVTINVKEDNLDRIEVTNKTTGETYQVENGHKLTEEGFYKIIAYDKAGNQSNVWNLTIDDEAPVITIENATSNNYYNHDVVVNISDIELQQTYLDGEKQGRVTTLTVKGDGTHTVSAVDRYGHKSEITFTIDTIPVALVNIRVNSNNANKDVAKVGDTIGVYLNVNELLRENPTFTINGKEYKVNETRLNNGSPYTYAVTYKVTDDMEEGKVEFTISNIYDKAGNPLADLSNINTEQEVVIDKTAPTINISNWQKLTFQIGDTYKDEGATAIDNIDGDITDKIEVSYLYYDEEGNRITPDPTEIKFDSVGEFVIKYTVTDRAGNRREATRRINVLEDNEDPVLTLKGTPEEWISTGKIDYEMSDNSGAFTIYYDFNNNYQSCKELMADENAQRNAIEATNDSQYSKGTYTIPSNFTGVKGVSVCLADASGNTAFRGNISF